MQRRSCRKSNKDYAATQYRVNDISFFSESHTFLQDGLSNFSNISLNRFMKSTVLGTIKKINTGYLGGARIVMRNLSDFFRTTAVSKLEFNDNSGEFLLGEPETKIQFTLPSDASLTDRHSFSLSPRPNPVRRGDSVRDRSTYNLVHKVSMRHRSIALDSNDSG
ncbi:hypothetical protein COOONC_27951 [Cooperia oncophora]